MNQGILIKSKQRVQSHGEVFTPAWMVDKMLNTDGIAKCCETLAATFLEPSAGEGAFLVAILRRKLDMVMITYCTDIHQFENFSLYALSTLYGIELLDDNLQLCIDNLYQEYYLYYSSIAHKFKAKLTPQVLDSAKCIIQANIRQGDFLTKLTSRCESIVFCEWTSLKRLTSQSKTIIVSRTEYTLQDIYDKKQNQPGSTIEYLQPIADNQQSLFDYNEELDLRITKYRYINTKITDVYKEEMEII